MSHDDELDKAEQLLQRAMADADAQRFTDIVARLDTVPSLVWPPDPDSAHPGVTEWVDTIRQMMARGQHNIMIPRSTASAWLLDYAAQYPTKSVEWPYEFRVQYAKGDAPYVGDPFVYVWKVAYCQAIERWVSGPAVRKYVGRRCYNLPCVGPAIYDPTRDLWSGLEYPYRSVSGEHLRAHWPVEYELAMRYWAESA